MDIFFIRHMFLFNRWFSPNSPARIYLQDLIGKDLILDPRVQAIA